MAEPLLRRTFSRLRGRERLRRKKSDAKERGSAGPLGQPGRAGAVPGCWGCGSRPGAALGSGPAAMQAEPRRGPRTGPVRVHAAGVPGRGRAELGLQRPAGPAGNGSREPGMLSSLVRASGSRPSPGRWLDHAAEAPRWKG